MSRLPAHRQAGFSLLEVLVSLVVVALTVGAAIRVYGQAADSASSGEQALSALQNLGYPKARAEEVRNAAGAEMEDAGVESRVRSALRRLAR